MKSKKRRKYNTVSRKKIKRYLSKCLDGAFATEQKLERVVDRLTRLLGEFRDFSRPVE